MTGGGGGKWLSEGGAPWGLGGGFVPPPVI